MIEKLGASSQRMQDPSNGRSSSGMSERESESWVEQVRGDEWSTWSVRRQRAFVDLAVDYWHQRGFPYYELTRQQISREVDLLVKSDPERVVRGNTLISSGTGLRLANYFHPQMFHVRCTRYSSPYDTFCNREKLGAAIAKSMRIWPDRYGARGTTLRRMLRSFSNTVGVSNFRPTAARAIVHRYSPRHGWVLDFSAGYGGRLLGALTLGRHYVGIDPNESQVRGLRSMIQACSPVVSSGGAAKIMTGAAEDLLPDFRSESFDLVFSSPPYFNRERYGVEPEQSFIRFPTLDKWLDGFLRVVLEESARILRRKGWLVLNIGNIPECLPNLALQYARPVLRLRKEMNLQLAKLPYKRNGTAEAFKTEPIFVFQKL
jgi:SAM-dependent methyltransferase